MNRKWLGVRQLMIGVFLMVFFFCTAGISAAAKEISECSVSLSQDVFTYDGNSFRPSVTVKDGDQILTEGRDYTLYGAKAYTVGRHEILIVGQGSFSGRASAFFEIKKAKNEFYLLQKFKTYANETELNLCCTAKGNAKLTFSTKTKGVSVTSDGKLHTKEGFLGTAQITVTAEETEFYQKTTKTFPITVSLYGTSISGIKSEGPIETLLPENDHTVKVFWRTSSLSGMQSLDGFQIRHSTDPTFRTKVWYVKVPMLVFMGEIVEACTMEKGLVRGTRSYFQIRTYKKALNNKTYYSAWSETVSHKVDSSAKAFYKGKKPKNGEIYLIDGIKYQYKDKKFTAIGCSTLNSDKHIEIVDKINVYGVDYPVTAIRAWAFIDTKVPGIPKKITIGKNVTSIGKGAFANQNYLNTIVIKSTKLKTGSIGKYAFQNVGYYSTTFLGKKYTQIYKVKIQVPKTKKVSYKKLLLKTGIKGNIIWR